MVVPEFRFDSAENARRPDEPHVIWNASVIPSAMVDIPLERDAILIRFRFGFLWEKDGGSVVDGGFGCGNAHDGDSQGLKVDVQVKRGTTMWYARAVRLDLGGEAGVYSVHGNPGFEVPSSSPTRPVVYPTAGKHHWKARAGYYKYDVRGAGECKDWARGDGCWVIPDTSEGHSPPLGSVDGQNQIYPGIDLPTGERVNYCHHLRSQGEIKIASRLRRDDLTDWGYDGRRISDSNFMGGSDVSSAASLLSDNYLALSDFDNDGRPNTFGIVIIPAYMGGLYWSAIDSCPLTSSQGVDADGDGIDDACDPDPLFRQKYVARGWDQWRPAPVSALNLGWGPLGRPGTMYPRGGFWDSDQDGYIEGEDLCPVSPGWGDDHSSNLWGEVLNWPLEDPGTSVDLGELYRGNSCDPYPVSGVSWDNPSGERRGPACGAPTVFTTGSDSAHIVIRTHVGASENDPRWRDRNPVWPQKSWKGQTYRCACRDRETGAPINEEQCLVSARSECFRDDVAAADRRTARGRGWLPVDRPGCSRYEWTYCKAYEVRATPKQPAMVQKLEWAWREEVENYPNHFELGDIDQGFEALPPLYGPSNEVYATNYQYALWSIVEIDVPPGPFEKLARSRFEDPERLPAGKPLLDVKSVQSRRLRSSFAQPEWLVSRHRKFFPGSFCPLPISLIRNIELVLWRPDPPPNIRVAEPTLRFLGSGGSQINDLSIVHSDGFSRVVSLDKAAPEWMHASAGRAVMLAPVDQVRGGTVYGLSEGNDEEPALLWVGTDGERTRWARLVTVPSEEAAVARYVVAAEGEMHDVGPSAVLVQDPRGVSAGVVDPDTGVARVYAPEIDDFVRYQAPEILYGRHDAAMTVVGTNLVVIGGRDARGVLSDAWLITLTGEAQQLDLKVPARSGARLTLSVDREALVFVGGKDARGIAHDDVWVVPLGPAMMPQQAKLVAARTPNAAKFDAAKTAILATSDGTQLRAWLGDPTTPGALITMHRGETGWQTLLDDESEANCELTDRHGGERCALASDWWATPGVRACTGTAQRGACDGVPGTLLEATVLPARAQHVALDGDAIWIANGSTLELWQRDPSGSPHLLSRGSVGEGITALAARAGVAVTGSWSGLTVTTANDGALRRGATLPLCGTPLQIAPMGDSHWAVRTTLGLAVVDLTEAPKISLVGMWSLSPLGGGALLPVQSGVLSLATCRLADLVATPIFALGLGSPAMAPLGPERLVLGHGQALWDLDMRNIQRPLVQGAVSTSAYLDALWADEVRGRVYGLGRRGIFPYRPIIDMRGPTPKLAGEHDIEHRILRDDEGRLSLRIRTDARPELAEVAR